MQTLQAVAGSIAVFTGIVHSVFGEVLIFRHLRQGTLVPALSVPPLRASHVRIIWATWHLASVFGWAFAAILFGIAASPDASLMQLFVQAAVAAYGGGSVLVLAGTRGRHPGWLALAVVAGLIWIAGRGA
jgi:hypothetical protein